MLNEIKKNRSWRRPSIVVTSSCHGSKISGSQQIVVLSVHRCTQEQKGFPILFFYRWTIEIMAASVKKDCWDPEKLLPLVRWRHTFPLKDQRPITARVIFTTLYNLYIYGYDALRNVVLYVWIIVGYDFWNDHVLDWWKHKDDPNVLFLKYEDLHKVMFAVTLPLYY